LVATSTSLHNVVQGDVESLHQYMVGLLKPLSNSRSTSGVADFVRTNKIVCQEKKICVQLILKRVVKKKVSN